MRISKILKDLGCLDEFLHEVNNRSRGVRVHVSPRLIIDSFSWERSSQGHDYWYGVYKNVSTRLASDVSGVTKCKTTGDVIIRDIIKVNGIAQVEKVFIKSFDIDVKGIKRY